MKTSLIPDLITFSSTLAGLTITMRLTTVVMSGTVQVWRGKWRSLVGYNMSGYVLACDNGYFTDIFAFCGQRILQLDTENYSLIENRH